MVLNELPECTVLISQEERTLPYGNSVLLTVTSCLSCRLCSEQLSILLTS